jgi:hypothetical protein
MAKEAISTLKITARRQLVCLRTKHRCSLAVPPGFYCCCP